MSITSAASFLNFHYLLINVEASDIIVHFAFLYFRRARAVHDFFVLAVKQWIRDHCIKKEKV